LKKKLQKEGTFRILKIKSHFEKPSEKKKREKEESEKRFKKLKKLRARL
jgi:small subunit ribosomal protein S21